MVKTRIFRIYFINLYYKMVQKF